jgi:hypothetical protein
MPADAGFICDKAALLGATIKGASFATSTYKRDGRKRQIKRLYGLNYY